jgi:hypothetical protein
VDGYTRTQAPSRNGLAITALVLGGIAMLFTMFAAAAPAITASGYAFIAIIVALVALGFGIAALSRARHRQASNKGMAWTGTALGIAGLVLSIGIAAWAESKIAGLQELSGNYERQVGAAPVAPAENEFASQPMDDITVSGCEVVSEYGYTSTEATVEITNSTDEAQSYWATISVNDDSGARVGEIYAGANSLAPGQSVTLSGMDATGTAHSDAQPGPAECAVAAVDRFSY